MFKVLSKLIVLLGIVQNVFSADPQSRALDTLNQMTLSEKMSLM
jgi:hypothetical protein